MTDLHLLADYESTANALIRLRAVIHNYSSLYEWIKKYNAVNKAIRTQVAPWNARYRIYHKQDMVKLGEFVLAQRWVK